ncbi:hypothetical protein COLO4_21487 [Corchorus olitorius]|uniref:VOC domain-containing protein n=1 Tax=Corchorus olitorius TaxID=93759 RepID=A0A1R3IT07_9ROSI|nr:hypothetical protein COLO4_21487 [Corchorus olitorius]
MPFLTANELGSLLLSAISNRSLLFGRATHAHILKTLQTPLPSFISNHLVNMYSKLNLLNSAHLVLLQTPLHSRSVVTWTALIAGHVQNGHFTSALLHFSQMRMGGLELGRSVHALAVKACVEGNIFVGSAVVDMYGKCGSIEDAERAFYEMPERNLVTWNGMIGGYAHQGCADMALALFQDMMSSGEVVPNYVTLVCVLSACSRAGEVKMGMEIFESMKERFRIQPGAEHYACIVDLLGRAGMVERAYEFIKEMPIRPTISVWGALLNACRVYKKPELGKIAAAKLFELDPKDSGNHVLLSNLFASTGRWEEANLVRKEMKDVGIKKGAGCSWITVKNKVHSFQAKDTSHEMNSKIQEMLGKLRNEMKVAGYIPDTNFALYDLEEEEKISEVFGFEEIESPKFEFKVIWLTLPGATPMHLIERSPDTKLPEGPYSATSAVADPSHLPRGHHICFNVSNFDSFVQSLKDKGIETFQRTLPNGKVRQVFFFDPDGNGLEVASREDL